MARVGALSGRGDILIGGTVRGRVVYAIDECHQGGSDGRRGRILGEDVLLREIWDHHVSEQLSCSAGIFAIHLSSYVLGRGSAAVLAIGPQPSVAPVAA